MKIEILKKYFAICKSKSLDGINFKDEFVFLVKLMKSFTWFAKNHLSLKIAQMLK